MATDDRKPTLSLCMIVRDAERSLAAALASATPFMDEVIVVDTGSTDRSREIALAHGARLFEFPWCDDFSAARNESFERATGDWVFWMDADDVLPAASGQELRRAIAEHPQGDAAFWVTVEEESQGPGNRRRVMGHAHVKLLPRRDDFRFCYRIHEQIAPAIRAAQLPILRTKAVVRHVTDRSPAAQDARRQRNLRLALLDLAEHPHDPFVFFSLGITYLFMPGGLPTSIDYLRRSIAGCKKGTEIQLNAYLFLGQAVGMSGDRHQEEQVYREALDLFPDDTSLLRRLGDLSAATGRLDDAIAWYETLLARGRVRQSAVHLRSGHMEAALRLGQLHLRHGRPERAAQLWRGFLERFPKAASIKQALDALQPSAQPRLTASRGQSFYIVISACNIAPHAPDLIGSLARQKWKSWQAVFVDDASTDGTPPLVRSLLQSHSLTERFQIIENADRRFEAQNLFHTIKAHGDPESVIVVVDGDGHLAVDDALDRLNREYARGWDVVWSNSRGMDGSRGTSGDLNPFLSPRKQPYVSGPLLTFKRRLFDAVTESDMQDDQGHWFRGAVDVALAMPVLDQTIKRRFLDEVLYVCNRPNLLSHDRTDPIANADIVPLRAREIAQVCRRPGKPLTVDNAFLRAHLYEFLQAGTLSNRAASHQEVLAAIQRHQQKTR